MRFKYYKRIIGDNVKKPIILFVIVFILIAIFSINVGKNLLPTINVLCESRAKAIGLNHTNETIKEYMSSLKYEQLMELTFDEQGKLSTLNANVFRINMLSSEIAQTIQNKLLKTETAVVNLPLGKLLGWSIFSGYGPSIKIKLIPVGNVVVTFKTDFESKGINQTKHTIYIDVKTSVKTVAPFISNTVVSENLVTVAETIIVGDIPQSYYNIEGVEGLDIGGTMEVLE